MATVITAQHKVCDMCGKVADKFIDGSGEKLTSNMGYIQAQSDRWEKSISINITASIPYHPTDDICVDCVKDAIERAFKNLENSQ